MDALLILVLLLLPISLGGVGHGVLLEESYIVHLHPGHDIGATEALLGTNAVVTHRFEHLLHGFAVRGIDREVLEQLPGVRRVALNMRKKLPPQKHRRGTLATTDMHTPTEVEMSSTSFPPWGVDFIDGGSIDHSYQTYWTGRNVDVYIVDTGVDTLHKEFQGNDDCLL